MVGLGAWCLALATGLGFPFAARLAPQTADGTRLALAFLLGATLLAYAVLGLGLLDGLTPSTMLLLLTGLSVLAVRERRRIGRDVVALARGLGAAYRGSAGIERILLLLAGGLTALSLVIPLLPVTSADAIAYATAVPARFALDGRIQFYPDSHDVAFVLLTETLHLIGYTLGLGATGVWFEVAAQVLLVAAAADAYRALWGDERPASAHLFGTVLLLMPLLQLMPFMVKAHLIEALAILVALTLTLQGHWIGAAAAVAVGTATKYIAALGIVPLLAPALLLGLRGKPAPLRGRAVLGMVLVLIGLGAPFYVRNFVWTGSPLFPVSLPGFTSPFHLRIHDTWIASVYDSDSGFGRGPWDLLLWWIRASTLPAHGLASYIGTFALTFLPLAVMARPRPRRFGVVLSGFIAATVTLFVLSSQFERYFLAPLLAMTALGTAGWEAQRGQRPAMHTAGLVILLGLGLLLTVPLKAYGILVHAPALLSREGAEQVLAATTPWYADLRRARAQVPDGTPVLCLVRNCQYLGQYRREDAFFRLVEANTDAAGVDPRPVWQGLRDQGIRHVFMRGEADPPAPAGRRAVTDWLARCGGRVVYRNPAGRFGTRDPQRTGTGVVVLVELRDALDGPASRLEPPCERPATAW